MRKITINRKTLSIILCIALVSILSLSIAYAALSVTLNIVGNAEISDASWNIKFSNVKVNSASVSISPKITNNTTLTFSANLENPGDFYKFTVDIVNDGSIDAMIDSIIKTPELTSTQKKYIRYEVKYIDGQDISTKQILKAKETKTISVLFSFRNDIPVSDLPTTASNFNVQLQLVYYQADDTAATVTNGVSKVNVVSGTGTNIGDEICIDEECFYVISSDAKTVTMLAKYNLLIGNKYHQSIGSWPLENPTGIQDKSAIGFFVGNSVDNPLIATKPFSSTVYWENTVSIYPAYVYNENSLLYEYVENYKTYLINLGVTPNETRLITLEELVSLGCNVQNIDCYSTTNTWVRTSTYWTGSATIGGPVGVGTDGYFGGCPHNSDHNGIRPVIVIDRLWL